MKNARVAWVAGLYEGEGSACVIPSTNGPRLTITNTDLEILERVVEWTGIGRINGPYSREPNKAMYLWTVTSGVDVIDFLDLIGVWLSERRYAQAEPVYERAQEIVAKQELRNKVKNYSKKPQEV